MARHVHRLVLPLVFPAGVSPGEGRQGNLLLTAQDGSGAPVLRGTALAGALRHAWAASQEIRHEQASRWFGRALEAEHEQPSDASLLRVGDCVIDIGQASLLSRSHIAIDRHRGAVLEKGLFGLQALPPGSSTVALLRLHGDEPNECRRFLEELVDIMRSGVILGGHGARGLGLVELRGKALYRAFDCANLEEHAGWLDESRAWRKARTTPVTGEDLASRTITSTTMRLDVVFEVPRGQDVVVGDGQGLDCEIEPQRVRHADGTVRWRLPGSALRGVVRSWMTRLAARAGEPVADSYLRLQDRTQTGILLDGSALAWGFCDKDGRQSIQDELEADPSRLEELIPCPIMRLFGSSFSRGRIHIADALSETGLAQSDRPEQRRSHVAVDRLTGGATEGFFFDSSVLVRGPRFRMTITIRDAQEKDAKWLLSSLRAIHEGILRVGSSKAGGRLLVAEVSARGPHHHLFSDFNA